MPASASYHNARSVGMLVIPTFQVTHGEHISEFISITDDFASTSSNMDTFQKQPYSAFALTAPFKCAKALKTAAGNSVGLRVGMNQTPPFWRTNQVGRRALLSRSTAASNSSTSVRCCFRQTCQAALDGCRSPGARISTRRASSRGAGRSSPTAM